jgi:hypothetical protein
MQSRAERTLAMSSRCWPPGCPITILRSACPSLSHVRTVSNAEFDRLRESRFGRGSFSLDQS